jgi:hypothetical protein
VSARLAWGETLTWPELQSRDRTLTLEAPEAVRRDIARTLDLQALPSLSATLSLKPWLDGVAIDLRLKAVASRVCGLSLEPFDEVADDHVRLKIVPQGSPNAPGPEGGEVVIDLDADDPPEAVEGAAIDLSTFVVEALSLALDPFPRKPGAVFVAPEEPVVISPFAALKTLADRPKKS